MNTATGSRFWLLAGTACLLLGSAGCRGEWVRPRSAGEAVGSRPGFALVAGQFKIMTEGVAQKDVGLTPHQIYAGKDNEPFVEQIPDDGRAFTIWVHPGVFCLGQPTYGTPPKPLGKSAACAEIPTAGKAYYVGTAIWTVKKSGEGTTAELEVRDEQEATSSSPMLVGLYLEPALLSQDVKPAAAAKYKSD